jgi:hypothetical protein
MLRRDLLTVQHLAGRVADGAGAAEVGTGLRTLRTSGALFQLRANCLTVCQTIGAHHHGEDAVLFPAVRRAAPHLAATVDRLEDDHRQVAALVQDIEGLARDLVHRPTRSALVQALDHLSSTILEHLHLEETTLQPVLESWSEWPQDAPRRDRTDR